MKIGLLGDVHADKSWIKFAMWKFHQESINTVLQVGDFGIYQDKYSLEFLKLANLEAIKYGIVLYVVPGNHEDWDWINLLHHQGSKTDAFGGWTKLRDSIFMAPRGLHWEWDGVKFGALAGAPSVDRAWRVRQDRAHPNAKNPLWHAGEAITEADVEHMIAGGPVDVMVAHDAPKNVPTIDRNIASNPHGFDMADLLYAADGRELMTRAFRGVYPKTFIHGHYHFKVNDMIRRPLPAYSDLTPERDMWTHVVGLGCNGHRDALGVYDTETQEAVHWDTNKDLALYRRGGTW